jgi:hypothetical protein
MSSDQGTQIGIDVPRSKALMIGLAAIAAVALVEAFNGATCQRYGFLGYLQALGLLAVPMAPALISLFTKNPLRAVGAALLVLPWLVHAHYIDCVRPYPGGGASLSYVSVLLYGLPCGVVGAIGTGLLLQALGVRVSSA